MRKKATIYSLRILVIQLDTLTADLSSWRSLEISASPDHLSVVIEEHRPSSLKTALFTKKV
jgi:hypothetical protein